MSIDHASASPAEPAATAKPGAQAENDWIPVFFYGLFMDMDALRARGLQPRAAQAVAVVDYRIALGAKAVLLPAPGQQAGGVVAELRRAEFDSLYAQQPDYEEIDVTARTQAGGTIITKTMINRKADLAAPEDPAYATQWRALTARLAIRTG